MRRSQDRFGWILSAVLLLLLCAELLTRRNALEDGSQSGVDARDQALAESALVEPERFVHGSGGGAAQERSPTDKSRPLLLSQVQCPPQPVEQPAPVALENFRFYREFASLRAAEVRDPESAENRDGVVALMTARQRRLGQAESDPPEVQP